MHRLYAANCNEVCWHILELIPQGLMADAIINAPKVPSLRCPPPCYH